MQTARAYRSSPAFTIVELLITIVVIGILAAVTIVGYNTIERSARTAAIVADLRQAATSIDYFRVSSHDDEYPDSLDQVEGLSLASSASQNVMYSKSASTGFCLTIERGDIAYHITRQYTPQEGPCSSHASIAAPEIAVTFTSSTEVILEWSEVALASSYTLEYSVHSNFSDASTIDDIPGDSITVYGLDQDTEYFFRMTAGNEYRTSDVSNVVSTTTGVNLPGAPVIAAVVNSGSQITVSWSAIDDTDSYRIEYATASNFSDLQSVSDILTTSHAVTGLSAGTRYYFRTYAINSGGDSAPSNVVNATTTPNPPTNVTVVLSGTAGAADYTATCAAGTPQFRYATTHRTDGSTADNWGSWSSWSTTTSNTNFITQGMYGRILIEARCTISSVSSTSRWALSAGEVNQATTGVSGTVTKPSTSHPGGHAQGTVTCPAHFSRYIQLSLRTRSSAGGSAWAPSGNNRGHDVVNSASGGSSSGTTTARTYNTTSTSNSGQSGNIGTITNMVNGYPSNHHNWIGGHGATVLYRCNTSYITWRAVISSKTGSFNTPLNNSNISLGTTSIATRPAAESNLTSY